MLVEVSSPLVWPERASLEISSSYDGQDSWLVCIELFLRKNKSVPKTKKRVATLQKRRNTFLNLEIIAYIYKPFFSQRAKLCKEIPVQGLQSTK